MKDTKTSKLNISMLIYVLLGKICEKKVFWDSVHVLVIFNTEIVEYLVRNFTSLWRKIKVFHDFN